MADYDTGKDILTDCLNRAGELGIGSAEFETEAKRYIIRGYWDICSGFPYLFAQKYPPLQWITAANIDATATVTQGSATVTLAAAPGAVASRKLVLTRDGIAARIKTVVGSTLTLEAGYPEINGSSQDADIFQDEYQLVTDDSILFPTFMRNMSTKKWVDIVSAEELYRDFPNPHVVGDVAAVAFITHNRVRVRPISDTIQMLEFGYTERPAKLDFTGAAATDTPIIPIDFRWTIADTALYYALVDMDDDRATGVIQMASIRLGSLRDRQGAAMKPRLRPREGANLGVRS